MNEAIPNDNKILETYKDKQDELHQKNLLIAKFIRGNYFGFLSRKNRNPLRAYYSFEDIDYYESEGYLTEFDFHYDYNSLIQVVKYMFFLYQRNRAKEPIEYNEIFSELTAIKIIDDKLFICTNQEMVWEDVVKFVTWYKIKS